MCDEIIILTILVYSFQIYPLDRCFKSGDVRVNEHIGLASMHQLFVREHNRIADALGGINTHWNDEQVFQESRRIVGAELQHVVYSEFLPSILGQVSFVKFIFVYGPVYSKKFSRKNIEILILENYYSNY